MKKLLIIISLLVVVGIVGIFIAREKVRQDFARPIPYPTPTTTAPEPTHDISHVQEIRSLFVPDWTLTDDPIDASVYDTMIYFGITPGKDGIDLKESGATHIDAFLQAAPSDTKKLLTVRMTDSTTNLAILDDKDAQKKLITQAVSIADDKGFSGIVLDLEISAIPFDSLTKQINDFTALFYKEAHNQNLSFAITIYGDTFYRIRPFDMKQLARTADTIMIMSYDFHKARGNPGPNFPLHGNEIYGYDMTRMVDDFLRVAPANKLVVVFGLYGYDWVVNGSGTAAGQGKPLTTQEINKQFVVSACPYKNCSIDRDSNAEELEIHYTDNAGRRHTIWSEDMESVAAKKEYLKQRGITQFSYWAYSYF